MVSASTDSETLRMCLESFAEILKYEFLCAHALSAALSLK